jgi:hypothetical protein
MMTPKKEGDPMNKVTIAVAFLAGLSGGLAGRYVSPPAAFAQVQVPTVKEIRAQSFTLVDSSNQAAGTFTAQPGGRIVLFDITGREVWGAGGSGYRLLR